MSSKSNLAQIATELYDVAQIQQDMQVRERARTGEQVAPETGDAFMPPRTLIEKQVAQIWIEFLGVEQVGIHDEFFTLGGDSIVGVQILSRVRERLRIEVPAKTLLAESFTVAKLARFIAQRQIERADEVKVVAKLKELEKLSDEEVWALLDRRAAG